MNPRGTFGFASRCLRVIVVLGGVAPPGYRRSDVKVREIVRLLEVDGWRLIRTTGSHRQFRHSSKPGTVTGAGKDSIDLPPGTLNSILKQAGLKR